MLLQGYIFRYKKTACVSHYFFTFTTWINQERIATL